MSFNHPLRRLSIAMMMIMLAALNACSDDNSPTVPGIEPEIVNNVDNFQFQTTAIQNYSGTLVYTWSNTGTAAVVDQSSSVSSGSVTLVLLDADGTQVYERDLSLDGSTESNSGVAGDWTIRVVCQSLSGTLNFRADKSTP